MQVVVSGCSAVRSLLLAALNTRMPPLECIHRVQFRQAFNNKHSQQATQDGHQDKQHASNKHQDRPEGEQGEDANDGWMQKGQEVMLTKFMESGFLQATKLLRDRLLGDEWLAHGKRSAKIMTIAKFEELCATEGMLASSSSSKQQCSNSQQGHSNNSNKGRNSCEEAGEQPQQPGWRPTYHTFTQLYKDPDGLQVVEDDVLRARLRSMMAQVSNEREQEEYRDATVRAEDMAKLLKDGPTSLAEMVRNFIPLPPVLKGG